MKEKRLDNPLKGSSQTFILSKSLGFEPGVNPIKET